MELHNHFYFEIVLPANRKSEKCPTLSGCCFKTKKNFIYSEIDELSYFPLNKNNGFSKVDMEFRFCGLDEFFYENYFINCVTIRTNKGVFYKQMPVKKVLSTISKVTKDGEFAIGISYFFETEHELKEILDSDEIIVEFAVAIKEETNVYSVVCALVNDNNKWIVEFANTYRLNKTDNINNYSH